MLFMSIKLMLYGPDKSEMKNDKITKYYFSWSLSEKITLSLNYNNACWKLHIDPFSAVKNLNYYFYLSYYLICIDSLFLVIKVLLMTCIIRYHYDTNAYFSSILNFFDVINQSRHKNVFITFLISLSACTCFIAFLISHFRLLSIFLQLLKKTLKVINFNHIFYFITYLIYVYV